MSATSFPRSPSASPSDLHPARSKPSKGAAKSSACGAGRPRCSAWATISGRTSRAVKPEDGIVVVVESGDAARGLLVDELLGKQEVVIKSLGHAFGQQNLLAGGAVLGDGWVGLILDVDTLVQMPYHPPQSAVPVSPAMP